MKPLLPIFCCLGLLLGGFARVAAQTGGPGLPPWPQVTLTIDSPANNQRFLPGAAVPIRATAIDAQGAILRLEFLDELHRIGVSEILTLVPVRPGEPVHHEFVWTNAGVGTHVLRVRARDGTEFGAFSAPVVIRVDEATSSASLQIIQPRDLSEVPFGDDVPVAVEAVVPGALVETVEFLANGERIGETHFDPCPPCDQPPCPKLPCVPPPPGTVITHVFTWKAPPVGKYALEARVITANGEYVVSPSVRIAVTDSPAKPTLVFQSPAPGATFVTPGLVPLEVTATDPQGEIRRVEFYAGDRRLGVSEILTRDATIPGRPRQHFFNWTNPPAGEHSLLAKARDAADREVVSSPRPIRVEDAAAVPVVTVTTSLRFAVEGDRMNSGLFELQRTGGDFTQPLTVLFEFGGTAKRGADYFVVRNPCWPCERVDQLLDGDGLIIPGGESGVTLGIIARADAATTPDESVLENVVLRLRSPPVLAMPGAKPAYEAGSPGEAEVSVVSRSHADVAGLIITSPTAGAEFPAGSTIPLEAIAIDPAGSIRRMEFFAGDAKIGVSEIWTDDVGIPGKLMVHHLLWEHPPTGESKVHARATTAAGAIVESESVPVRVRGGDGEPAIVTIGTVKSPAFERGDFKSRSGGFQVTRLGGDLSQPLTVFCVLGGTATPGTDYGFPQQDTTPDGWLYPNGSVVRLLRFPAGQSTAVFSFLALTDALAEGIEVVRVTLVEPPLEGPASSPLPSNYLVGEPHEATVEIRDAGQVTSGVVLNSPSPGARFTAPATIFLAATAMHPERGIYALRFFANGAEIGQVEYCCDVCDCAAPVAGQPFTGTFEWRDVKAGEYWLTVKAFTGGDLILESEPITIRVTDEQPVPRLTITKPAAGAVLRAGQKQEVVVVGVGRFGGITDVDLLLDGNKIADSHIVFFRPPNADEPVEHVFEVTLPEGEHWLAARDQADPSLLSPRVPVQVIGEPRATLTWVKPEDGQKFAQGTPIDLEIEAVDPKGLITQADFYADGSRIGGDEWSCPECRFAPGATIPLRFQWTGAVAGRHTLHAVARDAAGTEIVTKRIFVEVTAPPTSRIVATRRLPSVFVPGAKFTVSLVVQPGEGVLNYVVEEHPPFMVTGGAQPPPDVPRWEVTAVSDDGVYDVSNGAVKFGPFFDHQPRTLTYEITPNEAVVDVATFEGWAVADGTRTNTGGDRVLAGNRHHPADRDPADDSIGAAEVTAYGAAWKAGHKWAGGPNPIPVDYVTRAGLLWRQGERYLFDPTAGPAPLCWVSDPFLPPSVPGGTTGAPSKFRGIALRSVKQVDGTSVEVAVRILPPPGISAYAVEEHVTGMPVLLGGDGAFEAGSRSIRWGPFLDRQPRTLTYRLGNDAAGWNAQGVASFDGASVAVQPAPIGGATDSPRVVSLGEMADGAMQIVIEDGAIVAGAGYELEVSTDLRHWTRTGSFVKEHEAAFARDEAPATAGPRFYRAVRVR